MDLGDTEGGFGSPPLGPKKRPLPADLPRSLDDRRHVPTELVPETEMYDGWQGEWLPCSACASSYSRSPHDTAFPPRPQAEHEAR